MEETKLDKLVKFYLDVISKIGTNPNKIEAFRNFSIENQIDHKKDHKNQPINHITLFRYIYGQDNPEGKFKEEFSKWATAEGFRVNADVDQITFPDFVEDDQIEAIMEASIRYLSEHSALMHNHLITKDDDEKEKGIKTYVIRVHDELTDYKTMRNMLQTDEKVKDYSQPSKEFLYNLKSAENLYFLKSQIGSINKKDEFYNNYQEAIHSYKNNQGSRFKNYRDSREFADVIARLRESLDANQNDQQNPAKIEVNPANKNKNERQ